MLKRLLLIFLLFVIPCAAQDLRPSAYVGRSGIVTVRGGKIMNSTGIATIAGVDITPANNATTYIYLDLSGTPVVASNTTGFPSSSYFPICTVIKDINGVITSFTDNRPDSFMAGVGPPKGPNPWYDVTAYGAKGDGVADDTAAIQSVLNLVNKGAALQTKGVSIFFPQGTYKITNTLFYEGNNSSGIHFVGGHGATRGPDGAQLIYQGPANAPLFFVLGANATDFDHIDFNGNNLAKYILHIDATNEYTSSTVWNISSISRTSNLVTVTTTASHNLGSGDTVQIAGVTDASYNSPGTYLVSATDSATTFTFIQGGPDSSSSGGTATRYKSAGSSGVQFHNCLIAGFKSLLLTPTSVSRVTNVTTYTFATPHFAMPGDTVYVTGMANSTFNFAYTVTQSKVASVPSSLTFTVTDAQADASTSGGTVLLESSGLNIGHPSANTQQVSEMDVWGTLIQGSGSTQSMNCVKWNQGGNVKNFKFYGGGNNSCIFGFNGINSGVFKVSGTIFSNTEKADFFNISSTTTHIDEVESEPIAGARWISSSTGGNNPGSITVTGGSWQSAAAADDTVIAVSGNLNLIGDELFNTRTGTSVAKVVLSSGQLGNGTYSSLVSVGTWYEHASAAALPWYDASANQFFTTGGFHQNHSVSITSLEDEGGSPGAMVILPTLLGGANKIFSGTPAVTGNVVPFGGFINMQSGDSIQFRNNALNGDVIGLSKDATDIVQVGGAAGIKTAGTTFGALGTPANGTLIYCSDCTIANPCAGAGTGALAKRLNGIWVCN